MDLNIHFQIYHHMDSDLVEMAEMKFKEKRTFNNEVGTILVEYKEAYSHHRVEAEVSYPGLHVCVACNLFGCQ